jgi:hypothetical protein
MDPPRPGFTNNLTTRSDSSEDFSPLRSPPTPLSGYGATSFAGLSGAIEWLIEKFEQQPDSDLGGHALLALGEMGDPSCLSRCVAAFANLTDEVATKNSYWLMHTFRALATESDYLSVANYLDGTKGAGFALAAATTLAGSENSKYDDHVFRYVTGPGCVIFVLHTLHEYANHKFAVQTSRASRMDVVAL